MNDPAPAQVPYESELSDMPWLMERMDNCSLSLASSATKM